MSLAPHDQKHVMQTQQSLNWLQAYLSTNIDSEGCGKTCECPYKCSCEIKATSPDLDDFKNVDDLDVWELNAEDPHECCGCVCGCYNHKAAQTIKKLEEEKVVAEKIAVEEKVEAEEISVEKKNRAEAHIHAADVAAAERIAKANADRAAANAKADAEIAAARHDDDAERDKEEGVIKVADEVEAHDKWVAAKVEHETKMSLDEKIVEAEKIAAAKKAEEKAAYEEKKKLEKIAHNHVDMASDEVMAAEAALEAAKVKQARASAAALEAAREAECMRSCVTEENCELCHKH